MICLVPWLWLLQMCLLSGGPNTQMASSPAPQIAFRVGHRFSVLKTVFSPDGKLVATGSSDGSIKLWAARTGELLHTMHVPDEDVYSLAFSSDSATLASGSSTGNEFTTGSRQGTPHSHALLWDTATGALRRQLGEEGPHGYSEDVISVAFLPGDRVAVCTRQWESVTSKVDLWDARTGLFLRRIPDPFYPIFSPDGKLLAAPLTAPGQYYQPIPGVKLWDVETGKLLQTLDTENLLVERLLFSPDGKTLAGVGSPPRAGGIYPNPFPDSDLKPDKIFLWDTQTGAKKQSLARNTSRIYTLAFAPDGKTLASAQIETHASASDSSDLETIMLHTTTSGAVVVWNVADGKLLQALPCPGYIHSLAYSPDGSRLITVHSGGTPPPKRLTGSILSLWNPATGTLLNAVSSGDPFGVPSLSYAPDGKTLVLYGGEGSIGWIDSRTFKLRSFAPGQGRNIQPLAFSPDGRFLVSGGRDAEAARLWDLHTGRLARRLPATSPLFGGTPAVAFAPDSTTVATLRPDTFFAGVPSEVSLWDVRSGRRRITLKKDMPPASARPIMGGGALGALVLAPFVWNSFAFTPDGTTIVTAGTNNEGKEGLVWWDVSSGKLRFIPRVDPGVIEALAIAPNGRLLAASNREGTILWDPDTGVQLKPLRPRDKSTPLPSYEATPRQSLAFSPDSKLLAAGDGRVVHLWNVADGTELDRLEGHTGEIHAVAFSPDGTQIASASDDGTVRLWDLSARKKLADALSAHLLPDGIDNLWSQYNVRIVFQHDRPMISVAFSPDGRLLASGSDDETLRFWHVRTDALLLTIRTFLPREEHAPSAWISYTPEGYYEGSFDIKDYLRWQVGDCLLPAAAFERRYHRPDSVAAALKTS